MRKINFLAVLATMLFSCAIFTSCEKDESFEFEYNKIQKEDTSTGNDDNNDNGNEGNNDPTPEGDKGTIVEKYFGQVGDEWPSVIKLQLQDSTIVEFKVNLPLEYTLGEDEYLETTDSLASAFVSKSQADTDSTEWTKDKSGNYLRKITRTQTFTFSKFTRTLTSSHWEAYRYINGKQEFFKTSSEVAEFNQFTDYSRDVEEWEDENKDLYETETNEVTVRILFNNSYFKTSATTYIDRFIKSADEENVPENKDEMPEADLKVDNKILKVSDITKSPIYISKDKVEWYNVSFVETSNKFYIYVDGKLDSSWDKSRLAKDDNYNTVMFEADSKQWIPAILSISNEGWSYVCGYADGTCKELGMPMHLALSSGIKSFTENNTAEVSPLVKTVKDERSYNGKLYVKVSGYNVDGDVHITYTVAEQ